MILAHNKNLLAYLYENLKDDYEIGYYVGGMKEEELKKSEEKKLIVATYSMASEGLDIKTLTTLILATPKTDIVQSVGRILRQKHEQPLVVDIIDSHEIFKRQYKQRQKFYNQQNYKIVSWNHKHHLAVKNDGTYVFDQYNNDLWTTTYDYANGKYVRISKKNKKAVEESTIDQELSVLINDL
jgi:superfamily II DNA or RNA helicase